MAIFSRIKSWVSNEVLTASDLNAEFNNLLTNTKPESIEDYSADVSTMQTMADPGGVGTESLATSLAGEIQRLRYVLKRTMGAQWYSDPGRYLSAGDLAVETADIQDDAVTTAKLDDGAVTTAKLGATSITKDKFAALGQQISSSSGAATEDAATYQDITNLTVTITTLGRPVIVALIPAVPTDVAYIGVRNDVTGANCTAYWSLVRGSSSIAEWLVSVDGMGVGETSYVPPGSIFFIDVVAAGTYTYRLQAKSLATAGTASAKTFHCRLAAYEVG